MAATVSIATPTTISSAVPPKKNGTLNCAISNVGSTQTNEMYTAPLKVRRERMRSMYSACPDGYRE
jgi:hypothetical protein